MSWSLHCVTGRGRPYDVEEGTSDFPVEQSDRPWRLATGGCAKSSLWSSPESVVSKMEKVGCSVGRPGGPQTRQVGGYIRPVIKSNVQKNKN